MNRSCCTTLMFNQAERPTGKRLDFCNTRLKNFRSGLDSSAPNHAEECIRPHNSDVQPSRKSDRTLTDFLRFPPESQIFNAAVAGTTLSRQSAGYGAAVVTHFHAAACVCASKTQLRDLSPLRRGLRGDCMTGSSDVSGQKHGGAKRSQKVPLVSGTVSIKNGVFGS